jgi:hypothetical protein
MSAKFWMSYLEYCLKGFALLTRYSPKKENFLGGFYFAGYLIMIAF